MTISANCPQYSHTMRVNDTLAGKKMRCQKCESVVKVPAGEEEEFEDEPAPQPKSAKGKGKRKRSSGSGIAILKWAGLGGGGLLVLVAIGSGLSLLTSAGGVLNRQGGGVSWTPDTTGDRHVTVMLSGQPNIPSQPPNGTEMVMAASGNFQCGISTTPRNMTGLDEEAFLHSQSEATKASSAHSNVRVETIHGEKVLRDTIQWSPTPSETAMFMVEEKMYIANFGSNGPVNPAVSGYFFQSIRTH